MCLDLKDYIQILSTIVLAGSAYVAPYIVSIWISKYRAPVLTMNLKLKSPSCHLTTLQYKGESVPSYYFRLSIINSGRTQAEDCEVFIEEIYKENSAGKMKKIKDFFPVNLKWSGLNNNTIKNILPNKEVYCDIGKIIHPSHKNKWISQYRNITQQQKATNKFFFEFPEIYFYQWDCLVPGKYKLKISLYGKNTSKITNELYISWSGDWKDSEKDMFNELVIT